MKIAYFIPMVGLALLFSCGGNGDQEDSAMESEPEMSEAEPTAPVEQEIKVWRLTSYGTPGNMEEVPGDMEVTLMMDMKENRVSGKAACNNYNAALEGSPSGVTISKAVSTKKACPEPAMQMESQFLQMLEQVSEYQIESGQMVMTLSDGRRLVFNS